MKLSFSMMIATMSGLVVPFAAASEDVLPAHTMWLMGKSGVYVMSPDGSETYRTIPGSAICGENPDPSDWRFCRFNSVVSDGQKYVWAGVNRGKATVDLFDLATGAMAGAFETCPEASELEYHSLRNEIWVRCGDLDVNSTDPTHLDVISASNPSGEIQTNILAQERALQDGLSSSGKSVINSDLGDVGYMTDSEQPFLFKIDLSTKEIINKFEMPDPKPHGLEEAAFSKVNKHIYLRTSMCCSCGATDGSTDIDSCGRGPGSDVTPTTGITAGQTVTGVCGGSCEGKANVDTVGVLEFDTTTDTIVGSHTFADGIGGDPHISPDGRFVVMLGRNAGKTIRILKAGTSGQKSTVFVDLELGFETAGFEGLRVARYVGFVEFGGQTLFIMPSGTEHKIAIVDFTGESPTFGVTKVVLTDAVFEKGNAPHGRFRRVAWAVDTPFVWTNDSSEDEVYVVDVIQGKVVRTLSMDTSTIVSVQHVAHAREEAMKADILQEVQASLDAQEASFEARQKSAASTNPQGNTPDNKNDKDDDSNEALSIAAIVIGMIALVVGIANLIVMQSLKAKMLANNSNAVPAQIAKEKMDDEVGSKTSEQQPSMASVA